MNPVAGQIQKGLNSWRKLGAKVTYLTSANKKVPKIWLGSNKSSKIIILASGLHLEETSGPFVLLDATSLFPILQPMMTKDVNFLIYPVINQFGLSYLPSDRPKFLRYNEEGINYNDGWGVTGEKKAKEVGMVKEDILDIHSRYKVILAGSLHEDSETPGRGYIYTNKIGLSDRNKITSHLKKNIDKKILATKEYLLDVGEETFQGGIIEEGFNIVNSQDPGSLENWLADDLKIPTILSEAPFGLPLSTRKKFHLEVIKSALSTLKNDH